jgi:hypothetical protein
MAKLDSASLPYGMLQYYQVHYIIKSSSKENDNFLARCEAVTKGHFGNKRVIDVNWIGAEKFVQVLQTDVKLTEMLRQVMLIEGEIKIDPLDDHIRIYGKWIHEDAFAFNQTMFEIADKIAGHIKTRLRALSEMT